MQPVLSREQMQAMDRDTIETLGIPAAVLMEVAGRAVADGVSALAASASPAQASILCLAGTGNNGGDALVAARHLRERGYSATAIVLGDDRDLGPEVRAQWGYAEKLGVSVEAVSGTGAIERVRDELSRSRLVVDGVFGTGLTRPVEGWRGSVFESVETAPHPVVAVDIPSGIDADTGQVLGQALTADLTVTFQFAKPGLLLHPGRAHAGTLKVVDIGIPGSRIHVVGPVAGWLELDTLQAALPRRPADAHKGSFGHLLVVAGVPERPGSAILAARAALRAGAGLVTVATDEETLARLAPSLVEVMGHSLGPGPLTASGLRAALQGRTALSIGPSLPPNDATRTLLKEVLAEARLPVVLDAGALSALGEDVGWLGHRPAATVLTPHPGEAARLLGLDVVAVQSDRVRTARALAEQSGAAVVLKGATSVVVDQRGTVALSTRGNPGMATAGTGDVLTGVIGALLAQGVEPGLAARAGVELHGLAGDRATAQLGARAVVASDVVRGLVGPIEDVDEHGPS